MDHGNRDEEHASLPERALDPDVSTVCVDDALGNGEPEPGAVVPRSVRLPESIEDPWQTLGRDAAAGVGNPEHDLMLSQSRAHRDPPTGVREFDRIADE